MKRRERPGGQKGAPSYVSIIDLGTTMLRALVVEVQEPQAVIWGWSQVSAAGTGSQATSMACEEALSQAEQMAQERAGRWLMADQMIVGLPASQLRGHAWPVTQRRSRPERPIEERELAALLERALRLAINRLAEDGTWRLVDTVVVSLSVDGRGVTDPVGFRGGQLSASVFAALAPVETVEAWCLAAKRMEFSALTVAAAPVALAAGLSMSQAVLIDVGGDTTDLTCCRGGRPTALASVPSGGGDLTRSLVQRWGLSPEKGERLKHLYTGGDLTEESRWQIREVMLAPLRQWLRQTEITLSRLVPDEPLPQRLVLLGGGSVVPETAEAIRTLAWSHRLQFARHPEVSYLRPTDVPGVVNRTDMGRGAGDVTALALAAWAAQQAHPLDRPNKILAGLCRGDGDGRS